MQVKRFSLSEGSYALENKILSKVTRKFPEEMKLRRKRKRRKGEKI
jgi:hypothetical protein